MGNKSSVDNKGLLGEDSFRQNTLLGLTPVNQTYLDEDDVDSSFRSRFLAYQREFQVYPLSGKRGRKTPYIMHLYPNKLTILSVSNQSCFFEISLEKITCWRGKNNYIILEYSHGTGKRQLKVETETDDGYFLSDTLYNVCLLLKEWYDGKNIHY